MSTLPVVLNKRLAKLLGKRRRKHKPSRAGAVVHRLSRLTYEYAEHVQAELSTLTETAQAEHHRHTLHRDATTAQHLAERLAETAQAEPRAELTAVLAVLTSRAEYLAELVQDAKMPTAQHSRACRLTKRLERLAIVAKAQHHRQNRHQLAETLAEYQNTAKLLAKLTAPAQGGYL